MFILREFFGAVLGMVAMALALSHSDDPKPKAKQRDGLFARVIWLVPEPTLEKLNLTDEQKQKIQEIDQEFQSKRQESLTKAAFKLYGMVNAPDDGPQEPAPALAITHEITGGLLETRRIRAAYEQKFVAVLNENQRAEYQRLKALTPRERREARNVREKDMRENLLLFMRPVQDQLGLDEEQIKRIDAIESDTQTRLRTVLTDEQRAKYEKLIADLRKELSSEQPVERRKKGKGVN